MRPRASMALLSMPFSIARFLLGFATGSTYPAARRDTHFTRSSTMAISNLEQLLKHELGDLLSAERLFLTGLKQMEKQTSNSMIADRLRQHADETEQQIDNLER